MATKTQAKIRVIREVVELPPEQSPVEAWLRKLIREELASVLDEERRGASVSPAEAPKVVPAASPLLDRAGLARALAVSMPTIDKLRRRPEFPTRWVIESPRFDLAEVRKWLASRNGKG